MLNSTVEQRIEKAHLAIMKHPSFCAWAGLLFIGKWEVQDDFPTAAVKQNGDVIYGRKFMEGLPRTSGIDVHVNFVVLHETGHKALLHLTQGRKLFERDPMFANIAADHVVNNMILESDPNEAFAKMPTMPDGKIMGMRDPKYKGWSMKQVFDDLMKQYPGGSGAGKAKVFVVGKGQAGSGKGQQPGPGDLIVFDEHALTGEDGQPLSQAEQDALQQAVEQALRSGSYLAGKQGGNAKRLVGDMLEPKIDWRELLAEFVMETTQGDDDATWRHPLRRFVGEDMYFPSFISEEVGPIGCYIDVSGSVGDVEMNACLAEVVSVCRTVRPSKLYLVYWDSGIRKIEEYTPDQYDDIVKLTKPVGGGGTEVEECAVHANSIKGMQCAIILTDGYLGGGWGDWKLPTLWAITTRNLLSPVGKSVYLEV